MITKNKLLLGGAGALIVSLIIWRVSRARKKSQPVREALEYKKTTVLSPVASQSINLTEVADTLILDLGLKNSIFNPTSWTENDYKVYQTLRYIPKDLIEPLSQIYANKYKRNLRNDLNELLDSNYYEKIRYLLY